MHLIQKPCHVSDTSAVIFCYYGDTYWILLLFPQGMEESQEKEQEELLELTSAGDTTPLSAPPPITDMTRIEMSPDDKPANEQPADDSGSEGEGLAMEREELFIKLKESQYKNAVSDAELAKLRAKVVLISFCLGYVLKIEEKIPFLQEVLLHWSYYTSD